MRFLLPATFALAAVNSPARAIDFRFDVAQAAFAADNTAYFSQHHLPALAFPSVNGHNVEMSAWNNTYNNIITGNGNTFGIYYNDFNLRFGAGDSAATTVTKVNNFASNTANFGGTANQRWLVLNEVDAATWNGANGNAYRTWLVDTIRGLRDSGWNNIILWTPRYLHDKAHQSTWQSISQYAYLGLETYLDGYRIKNTHNYALAPVQQYYQDYYNSWTSVSNGAGVNPARLFAGEHFGVYPHNWVAGQYFGSNGISGTDWQRAIQIRSLAIRNIPFGGFIGYLWQRNMLATGDDAIDLATQLSYERAYAATMVVQSEVPTWTGNGGVSTSWADGFNWTGGLPSTTQHPYPLLAATNPNLPKQTTANFFKTIKANTTVTLDGNQSVNRVAFDSPFVYTIAPGTGGSLTLTGSGASLAVNSGSHAITANVVLGSNVSASVAPAASTLSISGSVTGTTRTLTKTGDGTLRLTGGGQLNSLQLSAGTLEITGGSFAANTIGVQGGSLVATSGLKSSATALSISGNGKVRISQAGPSTYNPAAGVYPTGSNATGSIVRSLAIAGGGQLDLSNSDLVIDHSGSSPLQSIRALLASGYNAGGQDGPGVVSTTARNTDPFTFALGYAENAGLPLPYGSALGGPLFSDINVDATAVLIKFTWVGDVTLDGTLDFQDLSIFNGNYDSGASSGRLWTDGDLNYDGVIDFQDLSLFNGTYDPNKPSLPEPGHVSALALAFFGFARRRTRA